MSKNVAIDQESMLVVYADWIAFLREKKGQFEGQLAKLQGKSGKAQTSPASVAPLVEPAPTSAPFSKPEASTVPLPEEGTPAWLFETASLPETDAIPPVATSAPMDEESDVWL